MAFKNVLKEILPAPAGKATLIAGLFIFAYLLNSFVLRPLHTAGSLDLAAVLFNAAVTAMAFPGLAAGRILLLVDHKILDSQVYLYHLVVAGTSSGCLWMLVYLYIRRIRKRHDQLLKNDRRQFVRQVSAWTLASGLGLLGTYSVFVEPRWPRLQRRRLPLRDLPADLAGLKVLHLTDIHLGRLTSARYLRRIVERCNHLAPDLVLLTGDYILGTREFLIPCARILAGLRSSLGTIAVMGNHDHWAGIDHSRAALQQAGAHLVDNSRLWISRGGLTDAIPAGGGLCVAGVGDLWEDRSDLDAALRNADPAMPCLLLSHNPDFAETDAVKNSPYRVDLMLSGHTHGGQVRLPGVPPFITPSRYGSKYAAGLVQGPRFPVFVSVGIGITILPVRFMVRPEIVLLELVRA